MKMLKNICKVLLGVILILPAILFGNIIKVLPMDVSENSPWTDGLFKNLMKAYKRYNTKSWVRRLILVFHYPDLSIQYLKILLTNEKISSGVFKVVDINSLIPQHDVQTNHLHHRKRVLNAKNGMILESFSPIIVVDNIIHDGHHRVMAYKEAGVKQVEVLFFNKIIK